MDNTYKTIKRIKHFYITFYYVHTVLTLNYDSLLYRAFHIKNMQLFWFQNDIFNRAYKSPNIRRTLTKTKSTGTNEDCTLPAKFFIRFFSTNIQKKNSSLQTHAGCRRVKCVQLPLN